MGETQDVDFLISEALNGDDGSNGDVTTLAEATTQANNLIAIAEKRKDCVAVISPRKEDCVNNATSSASIISFAETLTSSSYAVLDGAWCYQYDKYNDGYCYLPPFTYSRFNGKN